MIKKVSAHLLCATAMVLLFGGCEPQTKNKMLNIFFTGVPPLEETTDGKKTKEQEPSTIPPHKQKIGIVPQELYSHPVWAAGICTPCHESVGTFSTPGVQKKNQTVFKTGGGMPGKLTLPQNKLCIQCHRDKVPLRALTEKLWLHNTTAKGECLVCHDPHQSKHSKTLNKSKDTLCLSCHEHGIFKSTPAHQTEAGCLSCHNPHMGLNKNLLTREYREQKIPALQTQEIMERDR